MGDNGELWFILDMDRGVVGAFRTKREAIDSRCSRRDQVVRVHRYGPGAYEVRWHYKGNPHDGDSFFLERRDAASTAGWSRAIAAWVRAGSPVEPFLDGGL